MTLVMIERIESIDIVISKPTITNDYLNIKRNAKLFKYSLPSSKV